MSIEQFRSKYLMDGNDKKKQIEADSNPMRDKYLEWVQRREKQSKFATKNVKQIAPGDMKEIEQEHKLKSVQIDDDRPLEFSQTVQKYYQLAQINKISDDKIDIPVDVKFKYKYFQSGDVVYDRDGNFLYRIPGLANY